MLECISSLPQLCLTKFPWEVHANETDGGCYPTAYWNYRQASEYRSNWTWLGLGSGFGRWIRQCFVSSIAAVINEWGSILQVNLTLSFPLCYTSAPNIIIIYHTFKLHLTGTKLLDHGPYIHNWFLNRPSVTSFLIRLVKIQSSIPWLSLLFMPLSERV